MHFPEYADGEPQLGADPCQTFGGNCGNLPFKPKLYAALLVKFLICLDGDLPQPLGPISTVVLPGPISRVRGARARVRPKDFVTLVS